VNGGTPDTGNSNYWNGATPWVTGADFNSRGIGEIRRFVSDAGIRSSSTSVVRAGNLLIVTRTGVGKLAVAPCDIAISQDITGVYLDTSQGDTAFVYFLMQREVEELKKLNQGTSINGIIRSDLEGYVVHIPCALAEQRRIAEMLGTIDIAIEKTESLIAKYQQIKAGLMRDLFTRGVTADGKLRPPREQAPKLYQETAIGWLPKDWRVSVVRSCGEVKLGRQRSPDQHSGKWTMPYLRVANVFDGFIEYSDILEMDFTPNERRVFSLVDGDILLNEGQSLELVGRSSIYRGDPHKYCFQNTLVRFRCNSDNEPEFFCHLFKRWLERGQFQRIAKQTTSVAHLGADRFARISCPSVELVEQLRIADRLNSVDTQIRATKNELDKLKKQKLGLMQDLLTGKVRVTAA
jgi:type I restriction enzyme S subunit